MQNTTQYETNYSYEKETYRFMFLSEGAKDITKAIVYTPFITANGQKLYNLGFGNYNDTINDFEDSDNSNNGDMREVFNTVLNTIPSFFKLETDIPLYISGSDSSDEFEEKCKQSCSKKCKGSECKNKHRRIRTYTYFINKNFERITKEYIIFGFDSQIDDFVQYVPTNNYTAILVYKKK